MGGTFLAVLQEQVAGLLLECRLRVGVDQQALDAQQHVLDAQLCRPVPLEHINTSLAIGAHVRVEDLGQEVALCGKRQGSPSPAGVPCGNKPPACVQGSLRAPNGDMQVSVVLRVGEQLDAIKWVSRQHLHHLVHQSDEGEECDCGRPERVPPPPSSAVQEANQGRRESTATPPRTHSPALVPAAADANCALSADPPAEGAQLHSHLSF